MATVPAAVDGPLILTESNAILMYAADMSGPQKTPAAYPQDLQTRAEINKWLFWEASVWFQSCYVYLVQNVVMPLMGKEPGAKILEEERPKWERLAAVLDAQLGKTKFVVGDHPTIADISIASSIHVHEASKFPMEAYPNLARWIREVEGLQCWKETQGAVDKALLPGKQTQTNGEQDGLRANSSVRAKLNYTKELPDRLTEIYFYEDGEGKWKGVHEPGDDEQEVSFYDGWGRVGEFDVDRHGFAVKDFASEYKGGWEDEAGVRESFYPEVVEFLKREMGAQRVLVFDHTIRTKANQAKKLTDQTNTSQRAPVRLVHCDYTAESGPKRVQQLLVNEADDLLSRRVAFINVWMPLKKVEEMPLAMCDVTSSPPADFFKLYLRYRDRTGENYVMRHSEKHKWWYFPDMEAGKVILLKTFDSEQGKARFVGHSAFEDPTSKKDAPARESVEIRAIVFF
ncbi:hypothetical protein LTR62_007812 [Meristemomyces frigidus]|uniref:Glutathione S-transferase n=1 Tax=Meristemomyces frigidus TaxID=1508187 RepID=A0AAN7TLL2_9PEZI|nr:hypothetical protein LTR62_007812 [Meristemomyces frigidus]